MRTFDVIVIGSGSGQLVADAALASGMRVALIEKGLFGGTCLNVGCIPTKLLVHVADRVCEIRRSPLFGIDTKIQSIDFPSVMNFMRTTISTWREESLTSLRQTRNLTFIEGEARFVAPLTLEVNGMHLRAQKIFVVAGARPFIPPIEGLSSVPYLTNETALLLSTLPSHVIFIGGGFIACEFAHFFEAMGARVTILQQNTRLLPEEEPEASAAVLRAFQKRGITVKTNVTVTRVASTDGNVVVTARDNTTGSSFEVKGSTLFVAAGRISNADTLSCDRAGIQCDERGFIKVNEYFETTAPGVYAYGDVIGKAMFRHVANKQALYAWHNAQGHHAAFDYSVIPHAVFTDPHIAAVGLTERHAREKYPQMEVIMGHYRDTAMGTAMREREGFVKFVIDEPTQRILGCTIVGPHASILIQEVVNAMAIGGTIDLVLRGMHIHPSLTEVVSFTLE